MPPAGTFQESGNQQDLFSVAPPPEPISMEEPPRVAEPDPSLPPPDSESADAAPAPLLTNTPSPVQAERKPPLVFSDGHPLPSRDGGRDLAPSHEKKYTAQARRGTVHLSPGDFSPDSTFGDLLVQARKQSGLTEEQVRHITKLNANYLSALEHADMKNLPPPVYVSAYIRTLCDLYGLDEESAALIREKLSAGSGVGDVPPTLIQSLEKDAVINEKEDRRLRHIFWAAVILLVCLFLLIVGIVVVSLWSRWHADAEARPANSTGVEEPAGKPVSEAPADMKEPAGKPEFTRAEFDALTTPQVPEASTLQMSRKRAVVPQ